MDNLSKQTARSKKRLGRGLGSGKGKTGGRGQKGQKARGKVALGFSGGGLPMYKKLPLLRGWGNKPDSAIKLVVNLGSLNVFEDGSKVDMESLVKAKLVSMPKSKSSVVKILSDGKLEKKLTLVGLKLSKTAIAEVEAKGGAVE